MTDTRRGHGLIRIQKKIVENPENDFLIHYGIRGQRWGIRRFQNEDRTLTEEGKERYSKASREERKAQKKAVRQARKAAKEAAKPESATWKAKDARFLDDAELNRRNSRLQRERQYIDMTTPQWKKNLKRGAIGVIAALTTVPLAAIAGDYIRKVYRGKANQFITPWLSEKVGLDRNMMNLKVK